MSHTFGLLTLPAQTVDYVTNPDGPPPGDPSLQKVGNFLQAIVNSYVGTAWIAADTESARPSSPAVKTLLTHDPERFAFNSADLPALFLWRISGERDMWAEDFLMDNSVLRCLWVMPGDAQEIARNVIPIFNAVAKAISNALDMGRDPAYADPTDPDLNAPSYAVNATAFVLATASSTSPATFTGAGLNGAIGGALMAPRRGLTITLSATGSPTWNTAAPIVVTYLDWLGNTTTSNYTPTSQTAAQTINVGDEAKQVVSVAFPAQLSTAGTLSVGACARAGLGSDILTATSCERLNMTTWTQVPLKIDQLDGEQRVTDRGTYYALDMRLECRERRVFDPSANAFPQTRLDTTIRRGDASTIESAQFPDIGTPIT